MKKVLLLLVLVSLADMVYSQCIVSNRPVKDVELPIVSGELSFDGSLSVLDVPITHYKWQIFSTGIFDFGDHIQTSGPVLRYNFRLNDPNWTPVKSYTVCLRLGYDHIKFGARCNENIIDLEPHRSCITTAAP